MKCVMFYESADDVMSIAPVHYPAHRARIDEFYQRGLLLQIGTFGDVQNEGSMAVFTDRTAAEEFIKEDPFVLNGVVRGWQLRDWHEVLDSQPK